MGWKIGSEVVYLAEGNAADTGTAIRWAQELGEQFKIALVIASFTSCLHGVQVERF